MQLLLTLAMKSKESGLLKFDTETGKALPLFPLHDVKGVKYTSGIVYSGKYLCFGIHCSNKRYKDKIVIIDIYDLGYRQWVFPCDNVDGIGNIISIYPGKLYLDSCNNNAICCIDFDEVNVSYFDDSIYYILNDKVNYEIRSLYAYKNTWFIASKKQKKIIDLTNDRSVFSDIYDPNCIFFNSNHRLCFLESEKGLFHCGDDIFFVGGYPTAAIEDCNKGGYWITSKHYIWFMDYKGILNCNHDLSQWGKQFNNIIEAKGSLSYETI